MYREIAQIGNRFNGELKLRLVALVITMCLVGWMMSVQAFAQTVTLPGTTTLPGTIGQIVYHDLNQNFAQDPGEALPNVTVNLLDASGAIIATDVTDINGQYLFTDLAPGSYAVAIDTSTLPDTKQGAPNVSDPDGGTEDIAFVTLTDGVPIDVSLNFGYYGKPTQVGMVGSNAVLPTLVPALVALALLSVATVSLAKQND